MTTVRQELINFRKLMKENANPDRAVNEKRYLKSPFKFFGLSLPLTNKIAKEYRKANKDAAADHVIRLAEALWASGYHDEKRLGLRILQFYPECLDLSIMPLLEQMLSECTGWDLVDDISIHLVGTVLPKERRAYTYLKKWCVSDNFWIRRASLISQVLLFRNGAGNKALFFGFAERMIEEKEFFIRKAIGWCVREIAKADPDEAFGFLMKIRNKASGLTLREGAKNLPCRLKERVLSR